MFVSFFLHYTVKNHMFIIFPTHLMVNTKNKFILIIALGESTELTVAPHVLNLHVHPLTRIPRRPW